MVRPDSGRIVARKTADSATLARDTAAIKLRYSPYITKRTGGDAVIRMHRESVAPQWKRAPLATAVFLAFAAAGPAHAAGGDPLAAPATVGTVTTTPVSNQYPARSQSVARSTGGNFVVAWVGLDGSIQARRYSANALPLDDGFAVTAPVVSPTFNDAPRVAMNDAGAFVVTWRKVSSALVATLYGQRYDANGTPSGAAFVISNSPGGATDSAAAVAMDQAGDFVTTWSRTLPTKTTNTL
ncbi:MAG: cya 3, partial [Nevskia sp.]|nr:cya 3 [Nevskia sp.]